MALTQAQLRVTLRWAHIIIGLILLCYVYSPLGRNVIFQIFVKFILIPLLVVSGIWLWKFGVFNKLFKFR